MAFLAMRSFAVILLQSVYFSNLVHCGSGGYDYTIVNICAQDGKWRRNGVALQYTAQESNVPAALCILVARQVARQVSFATVQVSLKFNTDYVVNVIIIVRWFEQITEVILVVYSTDSIFF